MSTVAFGALTTWRENSDSGTSESAQPPGLNSYIDILAALVPAEVLAIHAIIISAVTTTSRGQTQITQPATLRLAFWLLVVLSVVLFLLGRCTAPTPADVRQQPGAQVPCWQRLEWQDVIRAAIPPLALTGWTMLEPTSVWNVVDSGMSGGTRMLIAMVGAVFLAAITKALVSHSDNKLSPARQGMQAATLPLPAPLPADNKLSPARQGVQAAALRQADEPRSAPAAAPAAPSPTPNGVAAGDEPSVPQGGGGPARRSGSSTG